MNHFIFLKNALKKAAAASKETSLAIMSYKFRLVLIMRAPLLISLEQNRKNEDLRHRLVRDS